MPLYVLSIQERAEQLASQFEGKPVAQKVKFTKICEICLVGQFELL